MEAALRRFENGIAPPVLVPLGDRGAMVYRYEEKSIEQALVQKLARLITGLHASTVLLRAGFLQDQGAVHRVLDEVNEDIVFLVLARNTGEVTSLHKKYLAAFYDDDHDEKPDTRTKPTGVDRPVRSKIRSYIQRVAGGTSNSYADAHLFKAYSGFVHASSANIMDMYVGSPPRFHVRGMHGSPHMEPASADWWNYLFRGFISCVLVGRAFGDIPMLEVLERHLKALNEHMLR